MNNEIKAKIYAAGEIVGVGRIPQKVSSAAAGDMKKEIYDVNDNGIVDNAEKVNNHTVEADVPANAKFTDTIYDDTAIRAEIQNVSNDIPTKTSELTNDSGFLTQHQDLSSYATKNYVDTAIAAIADYTEEVF